MTTHALNPQSPRAILIVDDQPLMREALGRVLAVVAPDAALLEADCIIAALGTVESRYDVSLAILDTAVANGGGTEAVERILKIRSNLPTLVLSAQDDPKTARAVLDAGASGFVSKRSNTRLLLEVIRLVLVGGKYIPPEVLSAGPASAPADASTGATPGSAAPTAVMALGLTQRQLQVLALLLRGQPNKLICRVLGLQEGTVKTHIAAIFRALGVVNRTEAAYAVSKLGIRLPDVVELQAAVDAAVKPAVIEPAVIEQGPPRRSPSEAAVHRAFGTPTASRRLTLVG